MTIKKIYKSWRRQILGRWKQVEKYWMEERRQRYTFTDFTVCVIKFDIYEREGEKGRCGYFCEAAVAAWTFRGSARFLKMQTI